MRTLIPRIPEGHTWHVEMITWDGPRTLRIVWKHPEGFRVESVSVRPRWWLLGFWNCYIGGLLRIRDDNRSARARSRDAAAFRNAQAAIARNPKENQ